MFYLHTVLHLWLVFDTVCNSISFVCQLVALEIKQTDKLRFSVDKQCAAKLTAALCDGTVWHLVELTRGVDMNISC